MGFLAGKRALIVGLATERSIAYGIAQAMRREGAELAFSYQERFKDRVEAMAAEFGAGEVFEMDVASDDSIAAAFAALGKKWDGLDIVVHAVAFAPSDAIRGGFVESTTRENFRIAHDISSYSLTALAKAAEPMLRGRAGSLLTLTYLGAVRSVPNYNVMGVAKASLEASVRFLAADLGPKGIRVNAISAGPIKTLAAAGIAGFRKMLGHVAGVAPLRRNVTIEDVGNAAAFLCSDLAAGITGEVIYVDGGFNSVGMSFRRVGRATQPDLFEQLVVLDDLRGALGFVDVRGELFVAVLHFRPALARRFLGGHFLRRVRVAHLRDRVNGVVAVVGRDTAEVRLRFGDLVVRRIERRAHDRRRSDAVLTRHEALADRTELQRARHARPRLALLQARHRERALRGRCLAHPLRLQLLANLRAHACERTRLGGLCSVTRNTSARSSPTVTSGLF